MNLSNIGSKTIESCFYILFFLTPLIWLPVTSELFEFNKMILVYLLTLVVIGCWLLKSLSDNKFQLKRTPLDIPIGLFLLASTLSTIFSLDPHTSLFGYYGRWHGGLLSTISYIVLFYAFVTHFNKSQVYYFLVTLLTSGLIVSLYAILQHPNPLFRESVAGQTVLHGIDYDYWAVNVESRVFSTFGQPNWLAAFLIMLLPILVSLLFILKKFWQQALVFLAIAIYYFAFTFTYSRGGLVGLLLGVLTFALLFPIYKPTMIEKVKAKIPLLDISQTIQKIKIFFVPILALILLVFIVNNFFGNALNLRGGLNTKSTSTQKEEVQPSRPPTQLEESGKETATIRTIVWSGAFDIFKTSPILGSGLETFGFSYYLFRPAEHNYTTEWDYLYNKAHNEYLNFLSTTGLFGFLSYIFLIAVFELIAVKTIIRSNFNDKRLLSIGLLAGFNANLLQNFFGFSVVVTGLLFLLFPAMFLIINDLLPKNLNVEFVGRLKFLNKSVYNKLTSVLVVLMTIAGIFFVGGLWLSDYFYNKSLASDTYQKSIRDIKLAIKFNGSEPLFQSELAINLAALALSNSENNSNKEQVESYSKQARKLIDDVVSTHPNHTAVWIDKRTIDFNLSKIDKIYEMDLLKTVGRLKTLAPTDASIQYDVALVYLYLEKNEDAKTQLEKVVSLKTDYRDAVLMLSRTYPKVDERQKAIKLLQDWLKKNPSDSEAESLLKDLLTV